MLRELLWRMKLKRSQRLYLRYFGSPDEKKPQAILAVLYDNFQVNMVIDIENETRTVQQAVLAGVQTAREQLARG